MIAYQDNTSIKMLKTVSLKIIWCFVIISSLCYGQNSLNASKDGAIIISDPSDGPVITKLSQDISKTNLVNISLGIGF